MRAVPTATTVINVLTSRSLARLATAATAAVPNAGDASAMPVAGATVFSGRGGPPPRRAPSPYVLYAAYRRATPRAGHPLTEQNAKYGS